MSFFNDVGRELGIFIERTVPGAVSEVYHDVSGIFKDAVNIPKTVVTNIPQVTKELGTTARGLGKDVTDISKTIFSSPIVLIGGAVVFLLLMRR